MPFNLDSMTKVRMLDVRVLAAKDRHPDDPPGAQLLLQATLPSSVLTMFDGYLPGVLFRKARGSAQGKLAGLEGEELTPIGDHVKRMKWQYEQTGCTIEIDYGGGGKRNVLLSDCKAHRVSISPRQGGSVVVQWTVDAPGLADSTWAKLPGMKATEIQMTMTAPDPADDPQRGMETDPDEPPAAAPRKPGAPERAALAKVKGDAGPQVPHKGDGAAPADQHRDGPWPFPSGDKTPTEAPPQDVLIETSRPGTRTARGRDATARALKSGAVQ